MVARAVSAVLEREVLKLFRQRGRLVAAMVRPLLWLVVIGAGFAAMQGAPDYQRFLVPGVLGMTLLFGALLAALSIVYDKESGVLRMLVIAPIRHFWIVLAKALAATLTATLQALLLLALLVALGYAGLGFSAPMLALGIVGTAFTCASLGLLIAAFSRSMENFATLMNFVIFPVFFLSGSLYPVQHLPAALQAIASVNPYTYGVDLLKHSGLAGASVAHGADFPIALDLAVLAAFSTVALIVASLRFSRDATHGPLVRGIARGRAE